MTARYAGLRRFAYLLSGDWAEAEDLVQDALVRCHRRWSRIHNDDPHPYVRRAVVNAAHNWRRARRLEGPLPESLAGPESGSDERVTLVAALRRLPLPQREVLVLRYFEQLSEAEIASHLGVAPGTVKSRTARGLQALRECGLQEEVGA